MKRLLGLRFLTLFGWTLAVVVSLLTSAYNQKDFNYKLALDVANANFEKDQAFRQWASSHGGVYVPIDEKRTPSSPYLSNIPERDITTPSGKKLTLMNPAYMLRQMIDEYEGLYGAKGHITALEILNPKSAPDEWEKRALYKFKEDITVTEISEMVKIKDENYLRLMRPMEITSGCLKCHGHQESYHNTHTAGGVSVTIPMGEIEELSITAYKKIFFIHFVFWITGMIILDFMYRKEKKSRDKLKHFANYDSLTELPNRHAYTNKIKKLINKSKSSHISLIFMDLDNFKTVNDSLGHTLGDMLLQQVTKRIEGTIDSYEIFSRFGGDEFVLLFVGKKSMDKAEQCAILIHQLLEKPFMLKEYEVYTNVSIGISTYPDNALDAETLLQNADVAMYNSKHSGRSQYSFYNKKMLNLSTNQLILESELHKALDNGELFMLYQPQIFLNDETLKGVEALIRWQHPTKGLISPIVFIPIAENNGLIMPIGEWIIESACKQLSLWKGTKMKDISISVNISAKQILHQNLCSYIEKMIEKYEVDSALLELEITESIIMENINETINILQSMKKLGVSIAIDDFGTGYSSLSYLKKLPIDKLKIDREFIKDIPTDKDDIAITNAIISLAKSLDLKIIAEGPETKEQIEFLLQGECDIAQGYYYSKPVTIKEVEELLY